jgi:hypothetical protein
MKAEQLPSTLQPKETIMLDTNALKTALKDLTYPTYDGTQSREELAQLRREHQEQVNALVSEWVDYLNDEYGYDLPAAAQSAIYSKAYGYGHSGGYEETEGYYITLADLSRTVRQA